MDKNIIKLIITQSLSRFGDNIEYIAICILCFNLTNSVIPIGIVSILCAVPNVIFTLIGGAVSEVANKKRMMFITELLRGIFVLAIPILRDVGSIEIIYVVTFIVSTIESFFEPCCGSYISCSIKEKNYMKINSFMNSSFQVISIVGLSVGGILVGFIGEYNAIIIDGITFFISAIVVLTLTPIKQEKVVVEKTNIFKSIYDGLKHIFQDLRKVIYLGILVIISVLISPIEPYVTSFLNNFADGQYLDMGIGILFAILSLGVILGNFLVLFLKKKFASVKIVAVMLLFAICGTIFMCQTNIICLGIGIIIIGIVSGILRTLCVANIITSVDRSYRARTSSVIILISLCVSPLATMVASVCIDHNNLFLFWSIEIAVVIVLMLLIIMNRKKMRDE